MRVPFIQKPHNNLQYQPPGGDGVRVGDGKGPLEDGEVARGVATAMAATGLFVLHVMIDPELKADMAKFTDESIALMESG
jgi:hypothetical protein|mmetsp:Transcript_95881/g.273385  ORF Transcript_95881/g.273385 Transcript_95881/m.273385 type:complete len:80 (+) Transcript_95881:185-424(+)